ncbi:MAG TPA: CDP-alcohol phosphatidyltransferase family protein [Actinomycetes bacterium]|nr:CDP-alcohol phosphatidyltransferase family protein [Actinomycetes bacterium]
MSQPPAVSRWNLANQLTVLRLLLVPVLAWLLYEIGAASDELPWSIAAFLVFIGASATDSVDGEIARRRGLITNFGIVADPIADKALTGTALIGLSVLGDLPWWVTIAFLVREFGVTVLRFWVIRHGVIPASRGGKLKTVLQVIAIGLYLLPLTGPLATGRAWVMGAALIVTLVTGVDYVARAVRLRRTATASS